MAYVPTQDLINKVGSSYKLVILAARRAIELDAGAPKLVDVDSAKNTTIALEEIKEGKICLKAKKGK